MSVSSKNLIVYKASAGSGKTFTLVKEYIAILLGRAVQLGQEPDRFRHILVVTFTNKATAELRERILNELDTMSKGQKSNMLQLIIQEQGGKNSALNSDDLEKEYRDRANIILTEILSDYTSFRVQTIDSFFQEVVRSFVFELSSAKAGAEIELNNTEAIDSALEKMLRDLDESNPIFRWVKSLYEDALEEGNKFNVHRSAAEVAEKLLYSQHETILQNTSEYTPKRIVAQKKALKNMIDGADAQVNRAIKEIRALLDNDPLLAEDSFFGFLKKFFTREAPDFISDFAVNGYSFDKRVHDKIVANKDFKLHKGSPTDPQSPSRLNAIKPQLLESLKNFIQLIDTTLARNYLTAKILLQHIDLIPIIKELRTRLDQYQLDNNILLISEVNGLMKKIIGGSSVPFLYEKVGGRISNYMIDEFQDTSHDQWENFRPLLEESLDGDEQNNDNYLVGDVKQSIYRWREADSSILNQQVEKDFNGRIDLRPLNTNWRSDQIIVEFNNAFFKDLYDFKAHIGIESSCSSTNDQNSSVGDQISKKVYSDNVEQFIPPHKKKCSQGFVQIEFPEKQEQEEQEQHIKSILDQAFSDGYEARDIAFLVRENKDATLIAEMLERISNEEETPEGKSRYKFLSNEALLINSSPLIQLIVAIIHCHILRGAYSTDLIVEVLLRRYYSLSGIDGKAKKEELLELPHQHLSILELVVSIANALGEIPPKEQVYLNAFLDRIIEFTEKYSPTYPQFYTWWERIKSKEFIEMGDAEINSIQILTIHKAKGLEFPVVIIPFADWTISKSNSSNIELCSQSDLKGFSLGGNEQLFSQYLVSGSTTKWHLKSWLEPFYLKIFEQNYMDNLNLLYVAFTRAINRLYVICPTRSSKKPYNLVSDIIYSRLNGAHQEGEETPKNVTENEESPQSIILNQPFVHTPLLSTHTEIREEKYTNQRIDRGILLHDVMARSLSLEDYEKALERLFVQNDIDKAEYETWRVAPHKNNDQVDLVNDWFALEGYKKQHAPLLLHRSILKEPTLYHKQTMKVLRPDRVILDHYPDRKEATIIDYKFGEKDTYKHPRQIKEYMAYFQAMGYITRGYLWYNLDEIEEIRV